MFLPESRLFFVPAALVVSVSSLIGAEPSQSHLEARYYTWRQSMIRGDYDIWRDATALFRQRMVRNMAVSEKKPFPEAVFTLPFRPPALNELKFVGIRTKGDTAAATYYGKIDFGIGGKPTNNAFVLLFARENGEWKYDTSRFFNLAKLPEVRKRLASGDVAVLDEQDGFLPLGAIPPAPPLCPKPQYIAKIFVDCPGRAVDAVLNDVSRHSFENTRDAMIVSGGLHGGKNTISFNIRDLPESQKAGFFLGVYIMPEVMGNLPGKAFIYYVEPGKNATGGSFLIDVNKALLTTMQGPAPVGGTQKGKGEKKK